jgi:hypothetical protein
MGLPSTSHLLLLQSALGTCLVAALAVLLLMLVACIYILVSETLRSPFIPAFCFTNTPGTVDLAAECKRHLGSASGCFGVE